MIKYFDKFDKVAVDTKIKYTSDGESKYTSITILVNKFIAENKNLFEQSVRNKFYSNAAGNDGHHEHVNIDLIKAENIREARSEDIRGLLKRFRENNDCVLKNYIMELPILSKLWFCFSKLL